MILFVFIFWHKTDIMWVVTWFFSDKFFVLFLNKKKTSILTTETYIVNLETLFVKNIVSLAEWIHDMPAFCLGKKHLRCHNYP